MARKTKAAKAEPQVDVGAEIFASLRELEKIKGIPVDYMVERLKQALANAYRKDREDHRDVPADNVIVNLDEHGLSIHLVKTAVTEDELEDLALEIPVDAARRYKADAQPGDQISIPVDYQKFGRIAAQTAKQVVIQGIREAERGMVADEFASKEHEILNGTVTRIDPRYGTVILELGTGREKTEAILPAAEQVKNETIREGQRLKVYLVEVRRGVKGPQMIISRTHPGLVKRLFELEVPEIHDGTVLINSIAREAGSRTKIAVPSTDENVDPIGACVGPRGSRVAGIVEELQGEKIDIIKYSDDPVQFVAEALSPADVLLVTPIADGKSCSVVVPDDQLSLAIGKEGQNARLAAKLTGWKIDIKPQSQALEKALADAAAVAEETEE